MSIFVEVDHASINKHMEELCGDKVEVINNADSMIIVLADGLGSGVKANILATLTSKIIGTMLSMGASIDEAVETIIDTLPVCKQREIAYSTFSIMQIYNSGECYLVEFDNPAVIRLVNGKFIDLNKECRKINNKLIYESRFTVQPDDILIMVSDGAIHAGVGKSLNLGWQWDNLKDYTEKIYRKDLTAEKVSKLLLSVCNNLYANEPGDDTTVVSVKIRECLQVNVMIGPPLEKKNDSFIVNKFLNEEGRKIVCGGTTSQIVSREIGKEIITNFNYIDNSIPPTASIEGIDLTTEGVLTMSRALEYVKKRVNFDNYKEDGASLLARILLEESTSVHFFIGRAINPAHQNPDFPLDLGMKLKLVDDLGRCLEDLGKKVVLEYC